MNECNNQFGQRWSSRKPSQSFLRESNEFRLRRYKNYEAIFRKKKLKTMSRDIENKQIKEMLWLLAQEDYIDTFRGLIDEELKDGRSTIAALIDAVLPRVNNKQLVEADARNVLHRGRVQLRDDDNPDVMYTG